MTTTARLKVFATLAFALSPYSSYAVTMCDLYKEKALLSARQGKDKLVVDALLNAITDGIKTDNSQCYVTSIVYLKEYEEKFGITNDMQMLTDLISKFSDQDREWAERDRKQMTSMLPIYVIAKKTNDQTEKRLANIKAQFDPTRLEFRNATESFQKLVKTAIELNQDPILGFEAYEALISTSIEIIQKAAKSEWYAVRWGAAQNPNTPTDILNELQNDVSPDVSAAAQRKRL